MPRLQCSLTKVWFQVNTNHVKELVEKYGSDEKLRATYVCRQVRKLRKEGLSDEAILTMADNGEIVSKTGAPKRLGSVGVKKTPKATSVTPNIVKNTPAPDKSGPEDQDVADFLSGKATVGEDINEAFAEAFDDALVAV